MYALDWYHVFPLNVAEEPLKLFGGKITLTKITSYFSETMTKMPLPTTTIKEDIASITMIESLNN